MRYYLQCDDCQEKLLTLHAAFNHIHDVMIDSRFIVLQREG